MRSRWQLGSVVALVTAVGAAAALHSPTRLLTVAEAAAADPLLFLGVVAVLYLLRPLVLWPTTLVAVVVGYGFGLALGVPIALAGAVATSVLPFAVARRLGTDCPGFDRIEARTERFVGAVGPLRAVTAARLAPIPADAVTCAAAVAGVRFRTFAAGVLVGELPWTITAVAVGASLETLATDGLAAGGTRLAVLTTVAALALLAGPALRRYGHRLPVPVDSTQ